MKAKLLTFVRGLQTGTPPRFQSYLKSLTLLLVLMVGIGNVWGASSATLELSSSKKFRTTSGSTLKDDKSNTWTVTTSNTGAIQNSYISGYHGQQFGTSTTVWTGNFSTSISGTITSVKVDANTGGSATVAVTVGTTSFQCNKANTASIKKNSSASAATWYEFTGSASGNITITVSSTSKAFYFGGVVVAYSLCTDPDPTTIYGECSVNAAYSLTENCFTSDNTNTPVFTCTSANKTSCTISGSTFSATAAGTYTIKATQEADATYCAVDESFDVVVSASCSKPISISKSSDALPDGCSFNLSKTSGCGDGDGESVLVTCTPADHYTVTGVSSTSGSAGTISENKCTVSGVKANATINVTFTEDTKYTIEWYVAGAAYSVGSPSTSVYENEKVAAIPTAPADNAAGTCATKFMGWSTSNLGSAKGQSAPTDLFTTQAGSPEVTSSMVEDNKIKFYAVFASEAE